MILAHPNREQLTAFLRGQLADVELASIAAHIEECDDCCRTLRAIPDDALGALLKDANAANISQASSPRSDTVLPPGLLEHPRYKVGKRLGAGGMGVVYLAEHRLMDRVVAIKIIHRNLIRHPRALQRFRQEVKAAARLSHPNIVTAHDADEAGDVHFLVMEYVDGVSLDRLVAQSGPLEVSAACHYIRQAAKGLDHAYQAGMVHRDIKPHNLMLTKKGQIKILDFGLARLASEAQDDVADATPASSADTVHPGLTRLGDVMGTPDYMAPEQACDPRSADIRADIYGLGCTLYAILTGRPPHGSGSARAKMIVKQNEGPTPITALRRDLPAELVAIIDRMIAPDPARRFQTPAEVVQALAPFAKMKSITKSDSPVLPPGPAKKATTPLPRAISKSPQTFLARCPFCQTSARMPIKSEGESLPCPQCNCYFTAVRENT